MSSPGGRCARCSGLGVVERDGKLYECVCAFMRRVASAMPTYVRRAAVSREHVEHGLIGMVGKPVFLTSHWEDVKAFIKVLYIKYPTRFIRLTSDLEIKDVFVGDKSKSARTDDYSGEIFNSVSDLVEGPDLLIVRLNKLSYKNKAAAGALEEALSHRLDYDRPVWAVNDPDNPFNQASYAYSNSVWELLHTGMEKVVVGRISPASSVPAPSPLQPDPDPDQQVEGKPRKPRKPRVRSVPDEDDDAPDKAPGRGLDMYGQGLSAKKRFGKQD